MPDCAVLPEPSVMASEIREAVLRPGPDRERAFENHPVVRDTVKLPTPAIKGAYELISQAVVHRDTGTSFIGDFRFGKTYGILALIDQLQTNFPLSVLSVCAKKHDRITELGFYTDLLSDMRHGAANLGRTASERRGRVLGALVTAAQAMSEDRLVLFVDEAQNWDEEQFTYLRDLSNDLQRPPYGIRLITFLFAQPALSTVRQSLLGAKRMDLIGRFMLHINRFHGILSAAETADLCRSFDDPEISEYPNGSGISYSEFFCPAAFSSGWRLEREAPACWGGFDSAAEKHAARREVGMLWMQSAIRSFLYTQWHLEHGTPVPEADVWANAVAASGYELTLGVT